MKECVFCNIVKTGNNNNEKEKNIILYEDDLLLITHVEKLINIIKDFYKKYFHNKLQVCAQPRVSNLASGNLA